MKSRSHFLWSLLKAGCIGALAIVASCEDNSIKPSRETARYGGQSGQRTTQNVLDDHVRTFYGPAVPIGQGVARAWVSVTREGEPLSLGVNLSEHAVMHQPQNHTEYVLQFPHAAEAWPFNHVTLGWNPNGHFPPGVYDVPHFDVHFNVIDVETREAIPGIPPPYMDPAPGAQYIPAAYIQTPGVEPQMGAHWIDVLSSEFQGGAFTNTLILGTYDEQVIFWEPMLTLQYLMSKPNDVRPVRQPAAYQVSGYYPMSYSVVYNQHPGEFSISLGDLQYHVGQ